VHRLSAAVDWIEARLSERLDVAGAARAAAVSPYHFCRQFRAATGTSVMGYVRARRLTVAAHRLLDEPEARLIDIAFDCGFQSQEAFTRAFKKHFRITPGAFRARPLTDPGRFRPPLTFNGAAVIRRLEPMQPTFTDIPETHVVGIRIAVRLDTKGDIPKAWAELHRRDAEFADVVQGHAYGLCLHKPGGPVRGFDYLAGLEVTSAAAPVPDGMEMVTLRAQRYAVFTHVIEDKNLGQDLQRSFDHIFGTWLPESDYQLAEAPDFEYYEQHRFDPKTLSGEIDLYIPVVGKEA